MATSPSPTLTFRSPPSPRVKAMCPFCAFNNHRDYGQAQFALLRWGLKIAPQRQLLRPITAAPPGGFGTPVGVAVTPNGSKVYVANNGDDTVSVISTATYTVTTIIPVGVEPTGLAVTPDGNKV